MLSNFSEAFVAFCSKLEQSLPKEFTTRRMVDHEGRIAALSASFSSAQDRKILGIMKTGMTSHCHEFRVAYAVPVLDEAGLADWWAFACTLQKTLIPVDTTHEFSMISLILVCGEAEKAALKKLTGQASEIRYKTPLAGWSSVRLAVADLDKRKIHTNRMGSPLGDLLKPLFKG